MTNLKSKKIMASRVFSVGMKRIKIDPDSTDKLTDAITRGSIRSLKKDGVIKIKSKRGISSGRRRIIRQKSTKRGRKSGSKEGAKYSRLTKKRRWIMKVRSQRKRLHILKDRNEISNPLFWKLYIMSSSGQIRSVRHLQELVLKFQD
tara:strand:- start:172 stop:612 length:441 start_codon:yes stop_codon:yes gene_type:complete